MGAVSAIGSRIFGRIKVGGASLLTTIKYIAIAVFVFLAVVALYHVLDKKDEAFVDKQPTIQTSGSSEAKAEAPIFELFKKYNSMDESSQVRDDLEKEINSQTAKLVDSAGWTPLHWAAYYDNKELAEKLVNCGAKLDAKTLDGKRPLTIARAANQGEDSVFEHLILEKTQ